MQIIQPKMDDTDVSKQMQSVVDLITTDIASIRTGKASAGILTDLVVSVYAGQQRLKIMELASVSVPDPTSIVVDPWDKSIIGDIKKGIEVANIGLNPSVDGDKIRIVVPPMTGEDRDRLVKLLGTKLENGKVMIRQIRGDIMHDIKKTFEDKELSEDEKFAAEKKLQELTDKYVGTIEELGNKKKQDILQL